MIFVHQSQSVISKKKGFTLIELLVVISIMSIMTMIIYTSTSGTKVVSRDGQRVSDINSIKLELEVYYNQNHQYPMTLAVLVPTYMPSIPTPPQSGEIYGYFPMTYQSGATICTSYQLWTKLEQSDANLSAKRGFNSTASPLPNNLFACGAGGSAMDASSNPLVYDVTPN